MKDFLFYKKAESGEIVDAEDCLQQIRQYGRVIIWGAGNLGGVLGKSLMEHGIKIEAYWDIRHEDIQECNACPVKEPLKDVGDKSQLLVIFCITNAFIIPALYEKLTEKKIRYMEGIYVYQALLCPISVSSHDIRECFRREECNAATCKRHSNVMYRAYDKKEKLFINTLDVYLTQKCSLGCKYCYIYINSYPQEKRVHFNTEQILRDVDTVCDAASYIKRIVPFGGEPFLHPDLGIIIEKMAGKKNVGVIDLISNGIFSRSDEVIKQLKYDNVKINISNYNNALPERLIHIREENIRQLREQGLHVVVHNDTPQWRKPGLLTDNHFGHEQLVQMKENCGNFRNTGTVEQDSVETLIVKDGRLFVCQHCDTVYNLGIVKNTEDSIDLTQAITSADLARDIKSLIHRDCYQACRFCNPSRGIAEIAGEQGVDDMYRIDEREDYV